MLAALLKGSFALLTVAALLAGAPVRAEHPATAMHSTDGAATIPFDSATVTQLGNDFTLAWHATGVARIRVYAGTNSRHVGRSLLVARGGAVDTATVSRLAFKARWYFEFVPDSGRPLVLADRSLHLESVSNFRDVGGYRTEDGRWVRMGVAYRSNGLARLNPGDYKRLRELNLHLICDLRMDDERRRLPDPEIPGAKLVVANVVADSPVARDRLQLASLSKSGDAAAVTEFVKAAYRGFVTLPSARAAYHLVFERLADERNLPTLFHCTAGKDRSGWAQAILLTILRIPKSTILQDYVLTDQYMSAIALQQVRKSMPEANDAAALCLVAADPAFLEAAFKEADDRFGSFDNYLREGLGLDSALLDSIRTNFLTGNPDSTLMTGVPGP
jgi:protein-tyrosine phosphatase